MAQDAGLGKTADGGELVLSDHDGLSVEAVTSIVKEALGTMEGDINGPDLRVLQEIQSISDYIAKSKREVAAIRPDKISSEHIPAATDELDAIVLATENATNSIMEAAEVIESVAEKSDAETSQVLVDAVTAIYEACGFQDITGQRIGKIVGVMQNIETKITGLVEAFSDEIEKLKAEMPDEEETPEVLDDSDLLNGPQLENDAQSQDEIDQLLASFD